MLVYRERPAAGPPHGLLVLHHGRGTDENDLLGLADVLDPERRLAVVTPRAPLTLPGWPGYLWYSPREVGRPDPDTFNAARRTLAELHDELWTNTGCSAAQTVLGGFSMGTVMSYALALSADRPAPAGILAFSGFVPEVPGWAPAFADRLQTRALIVHGIADPVISVEFGRSARQLLEDGGLPVEYVETAVAHGIDPRGVQAARRWLAGTLPSGER